MKEYYDEMLVLEKPIEIKGLPTIFGVLLSSEFRCKYGYIKSNIDQYIQYIVGIKHWMLDGNSITKDRYYWIEQNGDKHFASSDFVKLYIDSIDEKVGYKIYKFDCKIVSNDKEVDDSFILSQTLIDRYIDYYNNHMKIYEDLDN